MMYFIIGKTKKYHPFVNKTPPGNSMRKIVQEQVKMGEIDISAIDIELDSRDEIPQLLRGFQYLYSNTALRNRIFRELWRMVPDDVDISNGRTGMDLWSILVLGTIRLSCNWDYDKLQEIANNHCTLRQMLGHGIFDYDKRYPRQTLCGNIRWFTNDILDDINRIVVQAGNQQLGLRKDDTLHCRLDSFVVETDVHFPTDINLLWDAIRKSLEIGHHLAEDLGIEGWRQTRHNLRTTKNLFRRIQKLRDKKQRESTQYKELIREYIESGEEYFKRARSSFCSMGYGCTPMQSLRIENLLYFVKCGETLCKQIRTRCLYGKTIPQNEKMFSLFEPHTEWIVKGKSGINQELGIRVGILECDNGYILLGRVMQQEIDEEVAIPMITEAKKRYPQLSSCSFDKGFHSPDNQQKLAKILDTVILPRKGKLDADELAIEQSEGFKNLRRKHSAVESAIHALENHGLDMCPDHGIDGFERYVALAIVARNIQLLGRRLQMAAIDECEENRKAA
jgi:hypothetical protein